MLQFKEESKNVRIGWGWRGFNGTSVFINHQEINFILNSPNKSHFEFYFQFHFFVKMIVFIPYFFKMNFVKFIIKYWGNPLSKRWFYNSLVSRICKWFILSLYMCTLYIHNNGNTTEPIHCHTHTAVRCKRVHAERRIVQSGSFRLFLNT